MATTYDEPLIRNEYDETTHKSLQHKEDFEDYFIPFGNVHHATIHDSGIAAGLEVSAFELPDASWELRISPGVFVDGLGRMGVLAADGTALLDDTDDESSLGDTVGGSGLFERKLTTNNGTVISSGKFYLTIRAAFTIQKNEVDGTLCDQRLYRPWIHFEDVAGFMNDGVPVILAVVNVAAGQPTVSVEDPDMDPNLRAPLRRRTLGQTLEELRIRQSQKAGDQLQEIVTGKLRSGVSGGLQVTVPNTTDGILFSQDDGNNCGNIEMRADTVTCKDGTGTEVLHVDTKNANIEMRADTVTCKDGTGTEVLHVDTKNAWLRIGAQGNEGDLLVIGDKGEIAMDLNGKDANLYIGSPRTSGQVIVYSETPDRTNKVPGVALDGFARQVRANILKPISGDKVEVKGNLLVSGDILKWGSPTRRYTAMPIYLSAENRNSRIDQTFYIDLGADTPCLPLLIPLGVFANYSTPPPLGYQTTVLINNHALPIDGRPIVGREISFAISVFPPWVTWFQAIVFHE